MPRAVGDRSVLTPEIMAHYRGAQPSPAARAASAALPGYIVGASEWLREIWEDRAFADKPALVLWGLKDIAFRRKELERWRSALREVEVREFEDCKHFGGGGAGKGGGGARSRRVRVTAASAAGHRGSRPTSYAPLLTTATGTACMSLEVKLWKIASDQLHPVPRSRLDLEGRLEDWLCKDIGLLSDDLLVIGRQIEQHGTPLDLLAMDRDGNLVVVELKRERTPRDVVAQALDYASWVQDLGREDVERYTRGHLGRSFDEAFLGTFGEEPPEIVNERHRIYIVASSLDGATQRIVEYLSSTHGVDINAATFSYFNTDDGEFVARSLLLDEEAVERRAKARPGAKRQPPRSEDELRAIAEVHDAVDLWDVAVSGFGNVAKKNRSRTTLWFQAKLEEGYRAIISIDPESSQKNGLAVTVITGHIARAFGIEEDRIREACGTPVGTSFGGTYSTADNCFRLDLERLETLIGLIVS